MDFIEELEEIIRTRRAASPEDSYVARIFEQGLLRIAQKVGEEGVELALAATTDDKGKIKSEAADLLFHMLLLLAWHDISFAEIIEELQKRTKAK